MPKNCFVNQIFSYKLPKQVKVINKHNEFNIGVEENYK